MSGDSVIDLVSTSDDSSSSSDDEVHLKRGRSKHPRVLSDSSDDDDHREAAGGGKERNPKYAKLYRTSEERHAALIAKAAAEEEEDAVKREEWRVAHEEEVKKKLCEVVEVRGETILNDWQAKRQEFAATYETLFETLHLNYYRRTLVAQRMKHGPRMGIENLERLFVMALAHKKGKKCILVVVYEEEALIRRALTERPADEIQDAAYVNERCRLVPTAFATTLDEACVGIVTLHIRSFHHQVCIFKTDDGSWKLLDSNGVASPWGDYKRDLDAGLAMLNRTLFPGGGPGITLETNGPSVQAVQRDTYEWILGPSGLCHSISAMTAALIIQMDEDYAAAFAELRRPSAEHIIYIATVFMCSAVVEMLGTDHWSDVLMPSAGGGGGETETKPKTVRDHPLSGLYNPSDIFEPEDAGRVRFCVIEGVCYPFVPTRADHRDRAIFIPTRWDQLKTGKKKLTKESLYCDRIHKIRDLIRGIQPDQHALVTISTGHKPMTYSFYTPDGIEKKVVPANADPFRLLDFRQQANVLVIEKVEFVSTKHAVSSTYFISANNYEGEVIDTKRYILGGLNYYNCVWPQLGNERQVKTILTTAEGSLRFKLHVLFHTHTSGRRFDAGIFNCRWISNKIAEDWKGEEGVERLRSGLGFITPAGDVVEHIADLVLPAKIEKYTVPNPYSVTKRTMKKTRLVHTTDSSPDAGRPKFEAVTWQLFPYALRAFCKHLTVRDRRTETPVFILEPVRTEGGGGGSRAQFSLLLY